MASVYATSGEAIGLHSCNFSTFAFLGFLSDATINLLLDV